MTTEMTENTFRSIFATAVLLYRVFVYALILILYVFILVHFFFTPDFNQITELGSLSFFEQNLFEKWCTLFVSLKCKLKRREKKNQNIRNQLGMGMKLTRAFSFKYNEVVVVLAAVAMPVALIHMKCRLIFIIVCKNKLLIHKYMYSVNTIRVNNVV